ncbi:hypothetical protein [uncultured Neptuniibacter sp.]|uniref:hypothetical protein n=1 Tax=uncultured Neptuniibacter sp. TaxID=502143 RepID=UPI002625CA00|nr:hypothetical protein [uncultured Neptuniibacter sp.]
MPDIQKADPKSRKLALLLVAGLILLCLTLLANGAKVKAWTETLTTKLIDHPVYIPLITFIAALPVLAASFYFYRMGREVVKQARFPLSGQPVIKDTPIKRGDSAVRLGNLIQVMSIIIITTAMILPLLIGYLLHTMLG